jgi:hypothetical protein
MNKKSRIEQAKAYQDDKYIQSWLVGLSERTRLNYLEGFAEALNGVNSRRKEKKAIILNFSFRPEPSQPLLHSAAIVTQKNGGSCFAFVDVYRFLSSR